MRAFPVFIAATLLAGCAPTIRLQTRPQDAGKAWRPAFAGVYFDTSASPLFTWFVARAAHAGDPFFGEQLRSRPAVRDAFLLAGGRGGVTRQLLDQFWRYTSADSIVLWQIWCDDGAAELATDEFQAITSRGNKEADPRGEGERYYVSVTHDGTTDRYPIDPSKLGRCNLDRDRFTVYVSLYDRESPLPVARLTAEGITGLNQALEIALAESQKAFRVEGWAAWNWNELIAHPPAPPAAPR